MTRAQPRTFLPGRRGGGDRSRERKGKLMNPVMFIFVLYFLCYQIVTIYNFTQQTFNTKEEDALLNDEIINGNHAAVSPTAVSPTAAVDGDDDDDIDVNSSTSQQMNKKDNDKASSDDTDINIPSSTTSNKASVLNKLIERQSTSPSLKILLESLKTYAPPHTHGEPITNDMEEQEDKRCQRFGFSYNPKQKSRRRIFFGSNIADDSWHQIAVHAAEAYGLYHTVAFIESNITTADKIETVTSRKMRFVPTTTPDDNPKSYDDDDDDDPSFNLQVLQSGIFGPNTNVTVDLYIDNLKDRTIESGHVLMIQESMQRDQVLKRWKMNGMTEDDIAIFSDVDEFFSREFLLAAMTCDIPEFRKGQDCNSPKLRANSLIFESSAECITESRGWYHPDMIIGECVDSIGNSTLHLPPERQFKGNGKRQRKYGLTNGDYALYKPNNDTKGRPMYPLWKPVDFRTAGGSREIIDDKKKHSAFHIRNFFPSMNVLRRKFNTYTHARPEEDAETQPLVSLQDEMNMTINCALGRKDEKDARNKRLEGGFDAINGDTPILFKNKEYRSARQKELQNMILEDEAKFGSDLPAQNQLDSPETGKNTANKDHDVESIEPELQIKGTGGANATVIGMATRYGVNTFVRFVGSLRKTGYEGHIILGVSPKEDTKHTSKIQEGVMEYLSSQNVTMKHIEYVTCHHQLGNEGCSHPYPDIKNRWSRFPLARDWLEECASCTGPVLIMDVRDSFFQENPFGTTSDGRGPPVIEGLQVFEENVIQTTDHWLVEWPVRECKNVTFSKPMLCSGTTIGTREAMLQYLNDMYKEMKKWISDPKCHFKNNGDDQSIHNYLFYTQQLPYAKAIPPRTGIVNTVGVDGSNIRKQADEKKEGKRSTDAYDNIKDDKGSWIGDVDFLDYKLTDDKGYFINSDGKRSRVIHQYDRFGAPLQVWLEKHGI